MYNEQPCTFDFSASGNNNLSEIIRDFKSFTSRYIRKALEADTKESRREWMLWLMKRAGAKNERNKDFQFWQQHNHPIELSTNEMIDQRLDYTHNNPVEAGFVEEPPKSPSFVTYCVPTSIASFQP